MAKKEVTLEILRDRVYTLTKEVKLMRTDLHIMRDLYKTLWAAIEGKMDK